MILSRKFVKDYIDLDDNLSINEIAEAMTSVGNEYDEARPLINCTNLITGEVIECENHPDSDHLHVCKVNVGNEVLNIVCGAPNVRMGLKVIVALPGAKLPGGEIKKGVIRGVESNGMLCSKAELGLDNKFLEEKDKAGIHELPLDTKVGIDPIKVMQLDDEIIDFELTSNRGDLLSILGLAYELGAIYNKKVKDIDLNYNENEENIKDMFNISIKTPACSLFLAKKAINVTIKESPDFIKNRLIASGIRPINNVVDISNYVMLETGQPLHFYDADRLGDTLVVRQALENEKLTTLDNIERNLSVDDIVIANNSCAVGLAGVMGGLSTEVENDTKNIIIESAIFDNIKVRKTSKKILRSEASNRFEKGLDPKRTYMAIERSCALLEKYADATIVGGMLEYNESKVEDKKIKLTIDKINRVLGINLKIDEVKSLYEALGFDVKINDNELEVLVPSRRLDISIPEDLIEEAGRMYGMDNIIGKLPNLSVINGYYDKTKRSIRNKMISLGLSETMSYTLIPNKEVHKFTNDNFTEINLSDPMSEDRKTLRYSLLYSLKEIYLYNKSHNQNNICIFEMGKGFYKENGEYKEDNKLAALMTGDYYESIKNTKVDFYHIKGVLEELMNYLGYENRYRLVVNDNLPKELHPYQSAVIELQGKEVGIIGKVHPNVLKDDVYVLEINLDKVLANKGTRMAYKEIAKFPSVSKDIAFVVNKEITVDSLIQAIKKVGGKLLNEIKIFDIYEGDKIGENEKSIAFNLIFKDSNRTLNEEEVMDVFNKISTEIPNKFNCRLRDK